MGRDKFEDEVRGRAWVVTRRIRVQVAVKLEPVRTPHPQLLYEAKVCLPMRLDAHVVHCVVCCGSAISHNFQKVVPTD